MRLLVTGATGFVGQTIVDAAIEAGHTVRGMARDAEKAARTFADRPIDVVLGDVGSRRDLLIALEGMEVVVNAAATYSYRRDAAETMLRDNPAIVEAILSAARDAGTPHVVDVSSAVVFRPHPDGPHAGIVGINSPRWDASWPHWRDPYLQSKVLAEDVVDRHRAKGAPVTSIHPAQIIGPRDRGPGQTGAVIRALLSDPSVYVDASGGWVDVRDVADAVVRLAARPPGDRVIASATYARYRTIATELDRLTGRATRRVWLPPRLLTTAADLNDRLGGRLIPALPMRASLEWPLSATPVDGSSGERLLGRAYRPLEVSLGDTLRWWAANDIVPRSWIGRLAA
jgi:nucleoside-diphosphate-sugar epimerase